MRKRLTCARERGSAAVEFALVLPILVMILMGIIDFGMVTNAQAIAANAARDGARVASLGGSSSDACQAALSASKSLVGFTSTGDCSTSMPAVAIACKTAAGAACAGSYDTSREIGGMVIVTVTYTYRWISPAVFGLPGQSTISQQAFMRIETTS